MYRLSASACLLLKLAISLHAQCEREILVNVINEKNQPVVGFGKEDFSAKLDGRPVEILSCDQDIKSE
jgi:hypothetical protein